MSTLSASDGTSPQAYNPALSPPSSPPAWGSANVSGLLNYINGHPDDPHLYRRAQEGHRLLVGTIPEGSWWPDSTRNFTAGRRCNCATRPDGSVSGGDPLPDPSSVGWDSLLVYPKTLGRLGRAAVLLRIDRELKAGWYRVPFNENNLSIGIYFIRTKIDGQRYLKKNVDQVRRPPPGIYQPCCVKPAPPLRPSRRRRPGLPVR